MRRAAAGLLAVCAVTGTVAACGSGSTAAPRTGWSGAAPRTAPASASASTTPVADARDPLRLAVLATSRDRGAWATATRRLVPQSVATKFHIDFSSARLALVARAQPLFVVRGARAYCLVDGARSLTNCWKDATTQRGDASVTSICSPQIATGTIEVGGIVPNGIRRVTILRGGRFAATKVSVSHNVFVAILPAGNPLPLKLRWDGRRPRHSTGVPPGTTYSPCGASQG